MTTPGLNFVDVPQALALLEQGAALVDVRDHQETAAGHAPNAICLPMNAFDLSALPVDTPLVLVCRSGARSLAVAQALAQRGYETHNLMGGMEAWEHAGQPVVQDNGQPGHVL